MTTSLSTEEAGRRRRIRRSVLWLTALALAFYIGFILLGVTKAHG